MSENPVLGGTDGYRARFTEQSGPGQMNYETVWGLSATIVDEVQPEHQPKVVVTARDTRPHGEGLHNAVIDAAVSRGAEAWDLGVAPTPAAQKIAQEYGADVTIVMTASHNSVEYNGWKGMIGARKPDRTEVERISGVYWTQPDMYEASVIPGGQRVDKRDLLEWYEDEVVLSIEKEFGQGVLSDKILVYDGANGAGEQITPSVLRRLGARVLEFACDGESGGVINNGCGAADLSGARTYLKQFPELLKHPDFLGALANDGDADRMMGLGVKRGNNGIEIVEITGNHSMWVLAQSEVGRGIVGTEYTNSGLIRGLAAKEIGFLMCANGDVNVTNSLREAYQPVAEQWRRGGEFTGHLVDTDWLATGGDGVRMAAWLAGFLVTNEMTLGDLHEDIPLWPERMQKVDTDDGPKLMSHEAVQCAIDQAAARLGSDARLIVRASGTEPTIRLWAEALDGSDLDPVLSDLSRAIRQKA